MVTQAKQAPKRSLPVARVVRREDFTDDLWRMWIEPEIPFTFKPGQYCTIGLNGIERAYSIVSAPSEPDLELFIELVPRAAGGELTPLLYELRTGDTVSIRPSAKGVFTFKPTYHQHLMVSTVTGIVPYISILRDYFQRGAEGHRFYLLHGASYQDEFGYDDEVSRLAAEHPETVTFIPTVSRPQEERNLTWDGEKGRVNNVVVKYIEELGLDSASTLIYACGHPGMIEAVKEQFAPLGWTITEERFWKQ